MWITSRRTWSSATLSRIRRIRAFWRKRPRGAKTIDGLGMLVYQGAIGFKMWTGHDAPVDVMRRALADVFG